MKFSDCVWRGFGPFVLLLSLLDHGAIHASAQVAASNPSLPSSASKTEPSETMPLDFAQKAFPDAMIGLPFHSSVQAIGGSGLYDLTVTGDLPPGLYIETGSGTVAVGGVPSEAGQYQLEINVRDVDGNTLRRDFTIRVSRRLFPQFQPLERIINDSETFNFNDAETVSFPVLISDHENFTLTDSEGRMDAIQIADNESFTFTDKATVEVEIASPAVLTSPAPGSALTSASATFKWTTGTGVADYDLYLGSTGVGSNNVYQSGHITVTSAAVTTLPQNGATIYARLLSLINGAWQSHDYTYTEASPAKMSSPTPGSVLGASNIAFDWSTSPLATAYDLYVGSTGVGSNNLYQSGHIAAPTTTATVPTLPTNGATVYVRLLSLINGAWQTIDYTYKESPPAGSPAQIMTPTQGSVLGTSNVQFTWTAGTNVTIYDLYLGTAVGTNNLYQSGHIAAPTTTVTVPKLPANGVTVYARLLSLINGAWQYTDLTYTEQ
jgi:hypothetical protein